MVTLVIAYTTDVAPTTHRAAHASGIVENQHKSLSLWLNDNIEVGLCNSCVTLYFPQQVIRGVLDYGPGALHVAYSVLTVWCVCVVNVMLFRIFIACVFAKGYDLQRLNLCYCMAAADYCGIVDCFSYTETPSLLSISLMIKP